VVILPSATLRSRLLIAQVLLMVMRVVVNGGG
jgi:hypothetical protein